jgi:hypothetical protein
MSCLLSSILPGLCECLAQRIRLQGLLEEGKEFTVELGGSHLVKDGEPKEVHKVWHGGSILPTGESVSAIKLKHRSDINLTESCSFAVFPKIVCKWFGLHGYIVRKLIMATKTSAFDGSGKVLAGKCSDAFTKLLFLMKYRQIQQFLSLLELRHPVNYEVPHSRYVLLRVTNSSKLS